ncbi:MAG: GcrA family cell cycle regulator [Pseudomonadota bacterium]
MPAARWTDGQKRHVAAMLDDGMSRSDIAAHFGVTRNAICGLIDRNGLNGAPVRQAKPQRELRRRGGSPAKRPVPLASHATDLPPADPFSVAANPAPCMDLTGAPPEGGASCAANLPPQSSSSAPESAAVFSNGSGWAEGPEQSGNASGWATAVGPTVRSQRGGPEQGNSGGRSTGTEPSKNDPISLVDRRANQCAWPIWPHDADRFHPDYGMVCGAPINSTAVVPVRSGDARGSEIKAQSEKTAHSSYCEACAARAAQRVVGEVD